MSVEYIIGYNQIFVYSQLAIVTASTDYLRDYERCQKGGSKNVRELSSREVLGKARPLNDVCAESMSGVIFYHLKEQTYEILY